MLVLRSVDKRHVDRVEPVSRISPPRFKEVRNASYATFIPGGEAVNAFRLSERDDVSSGWREVRVEGEVDHAVGDQLRAALAEPPAENGILVDLTECDFVDGTGLGILVCARLQLRDRGQKMLLRGAHGQVRRLLSTAGVG
jgi:HptB-dependent secretion and biofilm anti anti-sigma factor